MRTHTGGLGFMADGAGIDGAVVPWIWLNLIAPFGWLLLAIACVLSWQVSQ
jgi:hypothetical protein